MAIPVTEKDALREQFNAAADRYKENILLKEPTLEAKVEKEAQKQVLRMLGADDYPAKMAALVAKKNAIEQQINDLNRATIEKVTGYIREDTPGYNPRYTYYSRGQINPFEEYPDNVIESLKSLVRAKRRELLMETAVGRQLNDLEESKTEFASELTLCSNHNHMRELWGRYMAQMGMQPGGRQLSRINIDGKNEQEVATETK